MANGILLLLEALLYFGAMTTIFRLRRQIGIGVFMCALGVMHFLETYLASVFYVALPLLRPLILVVVLFRGIDLFRTFDTFWVITAGGPGNATETLNILLYRTAFQNLNFGRAAALALIMLVIVLVVSQPITKRIVGPKDRR